MPAHFALDSELSPACNSDGAGKPKARPVASQCSRPHGSPHDVRATAVRAVRAPRAYTHAGRYLEASGPRLGTGRSSQPHTRAGSSAPWSALGAHVSTDCGAPAVAQRSLGRVLPPQVRAGQGHALAMAWDALHGAR